MEQCIRLPTCLSAISIQPPCGMTFSGDVTHMVRVTLTGVVRIGVGYGVYVIVIAWVVAFHWISIASVSATNRRGRSVLPALMMGTTLVLLSMVTDLPFTLATFLLIHSSTVVSFRTMVAFCVDAFQVIVPPVASTTARMGSRVRELRMMGIASREAGFPSTSIVLLPIFS